MFFELVYIKYIKLVIILFLFYLNGLVNGLVNILWNLKCLKIIYLIIKYEKEICFEVRFFFFLF